MRLTKGLHRVSVTTSVLVDDAGEIVHWSMDTKSSPKGPFMIGGENCISKARTIGIQLIKATYDLNRMKKESEIKKRGGVRCAITTPHVESISINRG